MDFENLAESIKKVAEALTDEGYTIQSGTKYGADFAIRKETDEHSPFLIHVMDGLGVRLKTLTGMERLASSVGKKTVLSIDGDYYTLSRIKI